MKASVKALVDAAQRPLDADRHARPRTAPAPRAPAPLAGDSTVRSLRTALLDTVFPTDGTTLADLRHPDRPLRQARLRRGEVRHGVRRRPGRRRRPVHQGRADDRGGLGAPSADGRQELSDSPTGTLTRAITGRRVHDRPPRRRHRGLGRPPRAAPRAASPGSSPPSRPHCPAPEPANWLAGQIASLPTSLLVGTHGRQSMMTERPRHLPGRLGLHREPGAAAGDALRPPLAGPAPRRRGPGRGRPHRRAPGAAARPGHRARAALEPAGRAVGRAGPGWPRSTTTCSPS